MSAVDRSRLPPVGPTPPFHFSAIHKDRLKNQLAVWTAEHRGLPVLNMMLVLPSGSAADFEGYEGLAAITADMEARRERGLNHLSHRNHSLTRTSRRRGRTSSRRTRCLPNALIAKEMATSRASSAKF